MVKLVFSLLIDALSFRYFSQFSILIAFYKIQTMFGLSQGYQQLWKAIIRPPRSEYTIQMLGPKIFKTKGLKIQRTDIELPNKENLKLQCSYYQPYIRPCKLMPCVIYLHGNSSSRLEGARIVHYLIARNITVFTLDFAGCGLSEGEYISLGFYERGDVDCVFNYLRSLGTVSSIGIWGRSMGAATALMYSDTNHEIGCLVLDSPFANLERLSKELAEKHGGGYAIFSGIALSLIKSTIKDKHKFNIEELDPIGHVKNAFTPAFFIHGKDDIFILPKHSQDLHIAYNGEKRIKIVPGDHNDSRPEEILEQIATFFYYGLCVGDLVQEDKGYIQEQKNQKKLVEKTKKKSPQQERQHDYEFHDFGVGRNEAELEAQLLEKVLAMSLEQSKKTEKDIEKKQEKK